MDWADRLAAECIKQVYARPDARDIIAAVIRDIKLDGVKVGLSQAQMVVTEGLAGRPVSVPEAVARIRNACQQI